MAGSGDSATYCYSAFDRYVVTIGCCCIEIFLISATTIAIYQGLGIVVFILPGFFAIFTALLLWVWVFRGTCVIVDDEFIRVEFFRRKIREIAWSDVVEIRKVRVTGYFLLSKPYDVFVLRSGLRRLFVYGSIQNASSFVNVVNKRIAEHGIRVLFICPARLHDDPVRRSGGADEIREELDRL